MLLLSILGVLVLGVVLVALTGDPNPNAERHPKVEGVLVLLLVASFLGLVTALEPYKKVDSPRTNTTEDVARDVPERPR